MRADGIKRFEKDARHFLYREYLRILRDHLPPVFIMENVKGLLSATHGKSRMFEMIVEDLSRPMPGGPRYRILPFTVQGERPAGSSRDYVVKSERFGVPQARHRVFLCGVREDVTQDPYPLEPESPPNVLDVLEGLPSIRSCLSKETDSIEKWISALTEATAAVTRLEPKHYNEIALMMDSALEKAKVLRSSGGRFVSCDDRDFINEARPSHPLREWLVDLAIKGFAGHDARSHMRTDLHRYFYAASFAQVTGRSPKLDDFPAHMAPNHANVKSRGKTTKSTPFKDRFRVQVGNRPSSTIVSHIAKDGHYFIHPDPSQCRSLTVREAARLQTFPDNYHFEGTRTQQFGQIGNAVPPYLAAKIAASIYGLALG
jgi:DNA (cytosine-5)-methyltransferase 1